VTEHENLALYVADLYEHGKDDELFNLAERLLEVSDESAEAAAVRAEVFRLARVVSVRKGDQVGTEVWGAHAWTAAMLSGNSNVAAALLLPQFFVLVGLGAFAEGRVVLDGMLSLIDDSSPDLVPSAALLHRLYEEKTAFSFLSEKRYADAENCYKRALNYARTLRRAQLKIRGGLSLCSYLAHPDSSEVAVAAETEMLDIAAEANEHGYMDVIGWATQNATVMAARKTDGWIPFEVT